MNPILLIIQRLIALHSPETPPWENPVTLKAVRIDFDEHEHAVLRQVAARRGIPVRHYAHKALLAAARQDLQQPLPEPLDETPVEQQATTPVSSL